MSTKALTGKFVLAFYLTLSGVLLGAPLASAHTLETDGLIGAVMHADPDDDPIVGQPTTFYFEFKDKNNKFSLRDCVCIMSISRGGQQVFSEALSEDSTARYPFPEKDVYVLEVNGQPKQAGQFQNFRLAYGIRVDRGGAANSGAPASAAGTGFLPWGEHVWHYIIFGVGFIVIGILYIKDKYKAKRKKITKSGTLLKGFITLFILANFLFGHGAFTDAACPFPMADANPAGHTCCLPPLLPPVVAPSAPASAIFKESNLYSLALIYSLHELSLRINNKSPPLA